MNLKILTVVFLVGSPLPVFAMPIGDAPEMVGYHRLEVLDNALQLNSEQKAKLEAIFKEQHEKFRAIHEESHTRIKAVLTPAQVEIWEAMKQDRHLKRLEKHQQKRPSATD